MYTCTAKSSTGLTSVSAFLTVASPHNPSIQFFRTNDPGTFPGPPSKPLILNTTETSVTLTWRRPVNGGASNLVGYTVEYFSSDLQSGWVVAAQKVLDQTVLIKDLKPHTKYVFIVRAENADGLSIPSEISDVRRTLNANITSMDYDVQVATQKYQHPVIQLIKVEPTSSTEVRLIWKVRGPKPTLNFL